tara:strand:- start:553 stop:813 length:261 start_codon:yes stop_codon:yes gene_type:complete
MENIEELLRDAFRAGMNKGSHQSYFDAPLDETEYIDSIKDELKLFFIPVVSNTEGKLQAVEDLIEFARNNCREWNNDEMEEIIDRL